MRDAATDIAIDSLGRTVIVGYTESSDLPTAGSAYQLVNDGLRDAFVAVINPAGTGASDLVYSSYLGGAQDEIAYGVALDSGDRIHLVGDTASNLDFDATAGAFQTTFGGTSDAFYAVIDPGVVSSLVYATYLGGIDTELADDVALDASDTAYITGYTQSNDFNVTGDAHDSTLGGTRDAFLVNISPASSGVADLIYSTYIGGATANDQGYSVTVADNQIYVVGETSSSDFSVTGTPYDSLLGGTTDAFVTRFGAVVNTAPELSGAGLHLTAISEDATVNDGDLVSAIIASAGGDPITDADAGALEGMAISSLSNSNGTWEYDIGSGWTPVGSVSVASSLLLRDTDSLRFVPSTNWNGTELFTFAAWDQTSGSAGTKVDTSTYGGTTAFSSGTAIPSITVDGVNDDPTSMDNTVITNENNTYTFSASDFNFSDIDGDTLDSVKITNLEALGSLQLSGADVILNQVIIRTEIDAGNLKFVPVNNASGTGYDSFGFSVNDGTSDSSSSYTMTIDVNDAPTTSGIADVTVNENASNTVIDLFASFADTEDVDASLIYTITSNTNQGLFSTTPIDGSAGTLTLDYAPNTYGTASITVRATDSGGAIVESTFLVTVNSTNLAPAAVNDAYTVNEDSSLVADWWNTAWDQRQQLTFDNSAQTETLIDFPVLVVLNSGNIDYLQTQANGEDLRFVDNDGTFLAHE